MGTNNIMTLVSILLWLNNITRILYPYLIDFVSKFFPTITTFQDVDVLAGAVYPHITVCSKLFGVSTCDHESISSTYSFISTMQSSVVLSVCASD